MQLFLRRRVEGRKRKKNNGGEKKDTIHCRDIKKRSPWTGLDGGKIFTECKRSGTHGFQLQNRIMEIPMKCMKKHKNHEKRSEDEKRKNEII